METDSDLNDNINRAIEKRGLASAGLIAWALDRVAMGLGEVADAIREHTKAVTAKEDSR